MRLDYQILLKSPPKSYWLDPLLLFTNSCHLRAESYISDYSLCDLTSYKTSYKVREERNVNESRTFFQDQSASK